MVEQKAEILYGEIVGHKSLLVIGTNAQYLIFQSTVVQVLIVLNHRQLIVPRHLPGISVQKAAVRFQVYPSPRLQKPGIKLQKATGSQALDRKSTRLNSSH